MSGVLADVYRSLLQQAAAVLNVARSQLAFERQEVPPIVIRSDYRSAPSSDPAALGGNSGDDRRGLTGSARLLADLYQLDQYAFDTNQRKLAVSKTISLSQLAPLEFQTFRQTGVLVFTTPMELFDREFPGHYLRLIRRVRTSVIALIPPVDGIRATLSNTGISRVVVGPEPFQAVTIRRDPETIALSVPIGGTGVFEGEAPPEMYLPFEGGGVDGTWEMRMPRAANRFDYRTLSDILITSDYLALNNYDYGRSVIQRLDLTLHAERAFSIRNDFADAWYDLHNLELLEEPDRYVVRLRVGSDDFPTNLDRVRLENVSLQLSGSDPVLQSFTIPSLKRTDPDGHVLAGGSARALEGAIGTRRGNDASWLPLIAASAGSPPPTPFGAWELSLRSTEPGEIQRLDDALSAGNLDDIILVLSYGADTPPWPD
jgi:Tc toxin complex TcA C-terminal TcB-binding domain